jgi:site-specific DNA recombinase
VTKDAASDSNPAAASEDISRLWRNRAEFGPRSAELEDLGIHWLSAVGDDTRRDGWGLTIEIKLAMAEHARREASYRTHRGQEGKAIAGQSTWGRAYGYIAAADSSTGQIEIEETQAAVVRRIFEMYADGMSPRNIAARLNAEGVPSPGAAWKRTTRRKDGKWLASAIHGDQKRGTGILNNRRDVGPAQTGRDRQGAR